MRALIIRDPQPGWFFDMNAASKCNKDYKLFNNWNMN